MSNTKLCQQQSGIQTLINHRLDCNLRVLKACEISLAKDVNNLFTALKTTEEKSAINDIVYFNNEKMDFVFMVLRHELFRRGKSGFGDFAATRRRSVNDL